MLLVLFHGLIHALASFHCFLRVVENELVHANSQHPEATQEAAIDEALNIIYVYLLVNLVEAAEFVRLAFTLVHILLYLFKIEERQSILLRVEREQSRDVRRKSWHRVMQFEAPDLVAAHVINRIKVLGVRGNILFDFAYWLVMSAAPAHNLVPFDLVRRSATIKIQLLQFLLLFFLQYMVIVLFRFWQSLRLIWIGPIYHTLLLLLRITRLHLIII